MIELSDSNFEKLELLISQIADLAGSQGLSEIEALTESALALLEQSALSPSNSEAQEDS
jgi:hypothetical protein